MKIVTAFPDKKLNINNTLPIVLGNKGFTLIELSIVLVIIGLIVGGILTGRDLINAAAVRAQITQIEKYNTAANTFRGKYGYLPGDIPNPYAAQFGFQTRGTAVGQGDGNGVLQCSSLVPVRCAAQGEEGMFWVDLSTALLIDSSFSTATPTSTTPNFSGSMVGLYFPPAKIGNNGYVYVWSGGWQQGPNPPGNSLNYFSVTAVTGATAGGIQAPYSIPLMTPAQAYSIDKKIDDGLPQLGNVIAYDLGIMWASGGPIGTSNGLQYETSEGAYDPTTQGPVVAGDGIATSGANQGVTTACYDNNAVAGATETYSLSNANMVNCVLSFRFQ